MRYIGPAFLSLSAICCAGPAHADKFVDVGINVTRVDPFVAGDHSVPADTASGAHVGIGVRRMVGERSNLGVRLELDDVGGDVMLSVRALDYRHRLSGKFALTAFLGAARLDLATPAYGYYYGVGLQIMDLAPKWDLGIDFRVGDEVARDNLLPMDPQGINPDSFYDVSGISVFASYRF